MDNPGVAANRGLNRLLMETLKGPIIRFLCKWSKLLGNNNNDPYQAEEGSEDEGEGERLIMSEMRL